MGGLDGIPAEERERLAAFLHKVLTRYGHLDMPKEDELYGDHLHFVIVDNSRLAPGWTDESTFVHNEEKFRLIRGINHFFGQYGIYVHYIDEPAILGVLKNHLSEVEKSILGLDKPFVTLRKGRYFLPVGGARNVGYAYLKQFCSERRESASEKGKIHLLAMDDDVAPTRSRFLRYAFTDKSFFSHNMSRYRNGGGSTVEMIGYNYASGLVKKSAVIPSTFMHGDVYPAAIRTTGTFWGTDLKFPVSGRTDAAKGIVHYGGVSTAGIIASSMTGPRFVSDENRLGTHSGDHTMPSLWDENRIKAVLERCGLASFFSS